MSKTLAVIYENQFLSELIEKKDYVSVYLIHGIKLTGKLERFSKKAIFLGDPIPQMIYKRSISTIIAGK